MKWLSTRGSLEIAEDRIVFDSPRKTREKSYERAPTAIARSDTIFVEGVIEANVQLSVPEDRVTWSFKGSQSATLLVGLNTYGYTYSIIKREDEQWKVLSSSGAQTTLPKDKKITFKISVIGSKIAFFVDGVRVAEAAFEISPDQPEIQVSGYGRIVVDGIKFVGKRQKAFVVMQFTDEFNSLYREVIKPTCEKFQLEVVRADDFYNGGLIIEDINRSLRESSVIIADITPNNPNVFYEVGYAHALGKPTILLSDKKRDKLPFDVSGFRTLFYDNSIGGKSAVEEMLRRHLLAIFPNEG